MNKLPPVYDVTVREMVVKKEYGEIPHAQMFYKNKPLGGPLNDNIHGDDGYRFHDVFHVGLSTILEIPYVTKALFLIKQSDDDLKRKAEIEECLSIIVFNDARQKNYFEKKPPDVATLHVMHDLGADFFDRDIAPEKWGAAIENIYDVFRPLYENRGGIIHCDSIRKTIDYRPV